MSTQFNSVSNGQTIDAQHVNRYIEPIQDLESGGAWYREADPSGTANAIKVNFATTANPVSAYTPGLIVHFKANATNTGAATLTITGPSGDLSAISLVKKGGVAIAAGDISSGQVIAAIYTEDSGGANKRFEVLGGISSSGGLTSPVGIADGGTGATSAPAALTALGAAPASHTHTFSQVTGTVPIAQGGTGATSASAARTALGTNDAANITAGTLPVARGGTGGANAAAARTNLGAQAQSGALDQISAQSMAKGDILVHNGTGIIKLSPGTNGQVLSANSVSGSGLSWVTQGGNVTGPSSSTDEAVARFDSTTGKLLQNSSVKITDAGTMKLPLLNSSDTVELGVGTSSEFVYGSYWGRRHLYANSFPLQPLLSQMRRSTFQPDGNGVNVSAVGFPVTAVGTPTARNVAMTSVASRARRIGYVSASTAGSVSGIYQTTAQYVSQSRLYFVCYFSISDASLVSGARMFIGLTNSVAAPTNIGPETLTQAFGIAQVSTDTTQFHIVASQATAFSYGMGTEIAPSLGKLYRLELYSLANGFFDYVLTDVGSGVKISASAGAPTTSNFLAFRAWRSNNATAAAVGLDIVEVSTESLYQ